MKYRNTLCHSPLEKKFQKKFSHCHFPSKTKENYKRVLW